MQSLAVTYCEIDDRYIMLKNKRIKWVVRPFPVQFLDEILLPKLCKYAKIYHLAPMLSFDQWKLLLSQCVC